MKKSYIAFILLAMILAAQTLFAAPLPSPKITSSFTPNRSCISDKAGNPGGSTGQGGCLYACENHYATYCSGGAVIDTFTWNVVGGTILGSSSGAGLTCVSVLWGPSGTGSISVVEVDTSGYSGMDHSCVTIINSPTAGFTPLSGSFCSGVSVNFTDASMNAMTWLWNFGDPASGGANVASVQNPTHLFSAPGTYVVTQIVFNSCGCSDTTHGTITITATPGPVIDCPATVCAGATKCYSTPSGCAGATYTWTIVGGTRIAPFGNSNNICIQWGSGIPQGSITLMITGCGSICPGPTTVNIPIVPTTDTVSGPTVVCFGSNAVYSLPPWPGTCYNWTVPSGATIIAGDSTNHIQLHWDSIGTYIIHVSWDNPLLDCAPGSASIQVTVKPAFTVYGPNDPICLNSTGTFYAVGNPTTPSTNFIWSCPGGSVISGQGTQSATIQFTSPGPQIVTATPGGSPNPYCTPNEVFAVNVVLVNPPASITGPLVVCANGSYTYTTPAPPSGLDVQWSVTNGTINGSIHSNPVSVTWGPSGPYSISVAYVQTASPFCTSTPYTQPVTLFSLASITGSGNVCMDQTVMYNAGSPNPSLDFEWSILQTPSGPASVMGSITTGQGSSQISVLWHGPGSTTVYLKVTVCSQSVILPITIYPKPTPTITMTGSLCSPVTLTATPGYATYTWSNAAITNPIAVTSGGTYTVTVTNAAGCSGTASIDVPQPPGPVASISTPDPTSYCPIGASVNTKLYALQGTGYTYSWQPGGSTANPFTATAAGTYYVIVTDANGCKDTSNAITITVGPCAPPDSCHTTDTIGFTINTPICNPVSFNGAYSPSVTGQGWNFGDPTSPNNSSNLQNPSHLFTSAGYYTVTYSGYGVNSSPPPTTCLISASHVVAVPLVADFSYVAACPGNPTVFTDHSTYLPPFAITSYAWDFGDPPSGANNTSSMQNPTHVYSPGTYIVMLTVSNGTCSVTHTDTLTINPYPSAAFTMPLVGCVNTDVAMSATVNGYSYLWAFGDAATSALQNTSHAYAAAGVYNVLLTVTNAQGCMDTLTQSITINPAPGGCSITPAGPITLCPNQLPFTLTAPSATSYQWYLNGIAIAGPAGTASTFGVSIAGNYSVAIIDPNGCKCTTPPVTVAVNPKPTINITVSPGQLVCLNPGPDYITISTTAGPGTYTFKWNKDGVMYDSVSSISDMFATPGNHVYVVTVTDTSTGCTNVDSTTIVVCNAPAAPVITPGGSINICQGDSVTLTSSIGAPAIIWSTGQTTQSITVYSSGMYTVTYTDPGCGCKSTASIPVHVFPYPDFTLFPFDSPDCCDQVCDTAHICAPKGYQGYQWLENGVPVPAPVGQEEEFYPPSSGSYQLILTGPNGCTDTSKPYCLVQIKCTGMCVTPPTGMVGWWPLGDPDAGVLDTELVAMHTSVPKPGAIKSYLTWTSGFGPSPASTVPGIGSGKVGDALYFFGQGNARTYVDVAHSSALTFSASDMSIDAWVRIDKDSSGIQPIVEKMMASPAGGLVGYRLYLYNGRLTFDASPMAPGTIQYPTQLTPAVWHHVAATVQRNSTPRQYKLYVDGALVQTAPITTNGNLAETADLIIGGWPFATKDSLQSIAIDELELFARVIDSADVASLYHADSKGKCRACGEACMGVITGTKWYDKNRNGVMDAHETGIENWRIALVVSDASHMPTTDTIAVTQTDSAGNYMFKNICPGDYNIIEEHRAGWLETYPVPGAYHIALTQNQIVGGYNFGNWHPKISILIGVGVDSVAFNPGVVYDGQQTPWPVVIAQLNPFHIVFDGLYGIGTEPDLSTATGMFSIRRRRVANYSFSQVVVNDSVLSNGSADSVIVTLTDDTTQGFTVGFFNIGTPDTTVRFRTFTADELSQADQAKVTVVKKKQTTFAANTADVITALIKKGGHIVIGEPNQLISKGKVRAYIAPAKQADVFATLNTKKVTHTGTPRGLDFDNKYKPLIKLLKTLPANKQNNKLVADMMALEVNIAASDEGVTPAGFGDLVLVDSLLTTDLRHINPSGTVRDLADSIGAIMTNWSGVSGDIYVNMDNIVMQINAAFSRPLPLTALDTTSWMLGKALKLNGAVELVNVPFLLQVTSSAVAKNPDALTNGPRVPMQFALHQNYPNPFNPVTVLGYDLPVSARVTLTIYNTLGQVVRTLVDGIQSAGFRSVPWNAGSVASGVYFYRMDAVAVSDQSKTFTSVKKMVLIK